MIVWLGAVVAAGFIGACGPTVLARIPEPEEPADDKLRYADLAARPRLSLWLGVVAAIAAGLVASRIDIAWLVPVWVVVAGVGAWLAFIDWHTRLLPFVIVYPFNFVVFVLLILAAVVEGDWSILQRGLIGGVVVYLIFRLMYRLYRQGIGYGDVRLSLGLGLALGALGGSEVIWGLWLGFALGAAFSIVLSLFKLVDRKGFAFGPYLILGAIVGASWSPTFL
ncbi:MAG: prepilin peptidase [Kineosporiaceae bacterium]|nr:prepilin peptidase [Aeromicrobium sp.]